MNGSRSLSRGLSAILVAGVLGAASVIPVQGLAQPSPPSSALQAAPSAQERGAVLFRQRCGTCHSVTPGARSTMGPNLAGVVGRRAGTVADYRFSNAMKQAPLTWTAENLDAFLVSPARMVRGTRMTASVANPTDRSAIVAYLKTVR